MQACGPSRPPAPATACCAQHGPRRGMQAPRPGLPPHSQPVPGESPAAALAPAPLGVQVPRAAHSRDCSHLQIQMASCVLPLHTVVPAPACECHQARLLTGLPRLDKQTAPPSCARGQEPLVRTPAPGPYTHSARSTESMDTHYHQEEPSWTSQRPLLLAMHSSRRHQRRHRLERRPAAAPLGRNATTELSPLEDSSLCSLPCLPGAAHTPQGPGPRLQRLCWRSSPQPPAPNACAARSNRSREVAAA